MAKFVQDQLYLSANEAGNRLGISYKTWQRWVKDGIPMKGGQRQTISVETYSTGGGYKYYKESSVEKLKAELNIGNGGKTRQLPINKQRVEQTAKELEIILDEVIGEGVRKCQPNLQ